MSILRSFGKALGVILFTTLLTASLMSTGFIEFTKYNNMKSIFINILGPQMENTDITSQIDPTQGYEILLMMCEGKDWITLPISEDESDTITIKCDDVRSINADNNTQMKTDVKNMLIASFFDETYYKEYDCSFLGCILTGKPSIIMSAKGHDFFVNIQKYLFIGTALGGILIITSAKKIESKLKSLGFSMLFVGSSYFILTFSRDYMISKISPDTQQTMSELGIDFTPIIGNILNPIMDNLLLVFSIGALLTITGYGLQFYKNKEEKGDHLSNDKSED